MDSKRKCASCKKKKSIKEFAERADRPGKHASYCKPCFAKIKRASYDKHRDRCIENAKKRNTVARNRNKQFIEEYLKDKFCVDCKSTDREVFEFDHRDEKLKEFTISRIVRAAYSLETIRAEVEKCDVRCANCHRKRTSKQFNWYKKT